jgi:hypothetical protein
MPAIATDQKEEHRRWRAGPACDEHAGDRARSEGGGEPALQRPRAASAVRTLAFTEMFMPTKPVAPDSSAPIRKPIAEIVPRNTKTRTTTISPTMAIVVYCGLR